MRRLTARRVRRLRMWIADNRCGERPGLTHTWALQYAPDWTSLGGAVEFWRCDKCGQEEM